MCATDVLAAQREREYLTASSWSPAQLGRKCRSYSDFSTVSDSVTDSDGDACPEPRELPSSKRRAGSSENLLHLESLAVSRGRALVVGSIPEQAAPRVRLPADPPVRLASSSPQRPPPGPAVPPAPAHECDGWCTSCSADREAAVLAIQQRFTLARAVTSPPDVLDAAAPDAEAAAPPPLKRASSDGPPRGTAHTAFAGGPAPYSREPSPAAAPRLCSLFTSSSMALVEPPSLISPSPSASLGGLSPRSSASTGTSPFGAAGPHPLKHSRSEETMCSGALAGGGSDAFAPGAPSYGLEPRASADLSPPRASMDSFVATSSHLNEGSAAEELFYRLNHARQTVDFVKRQAAVFAPLSRGECGVWDALAALDTLREYETALLGDDDCDATMGLMEHALQTAEACRLAYPEDDWLHLVGLIHDLGKLLAHKDWGAEPQWAVCGETYPVGCRFHPAILHSQFFSANPDRRRRAYSTATGIYSPGCGLNSVYMSWSAAEYLYMVLLRNKTLLPPEALFVVRYHRCAVLLRPGAPYSELLSAFDRACLPWVRRFRELARYTRRELPGRLEGAALRDYYDRLLAKYIPQLKLRW